MDPQTQREQNPQLAAAIAGIERGLKGMDEGTGEDAEKALATLERELGINNQAQRS